MIDASTVRKMLRICACLLIIRVTAVVLFSYRSYLPPDFSADFLIGRESYFFDGYHWAFFVHIASGPLSLGLGMLLLSQRFRLRWPKWHRFFGRIQVACVLLFVVPSGLGMAAFTDSGVMAGTGFAALAIATGFTVVRGWTTAVQRRFVAHRLWMWRCYVLLCSAVVLRVFGGLATVMGYESPWFYPLAAWGCWVVPLTLLEIVKGFRIAQGEIRRVISS